jgi:hypothetical protein
MLPTSVAIFTPASVGDGQYAFNLFFQVSGLAKYLNVGDIVQDSVGNQYEIVTWSNSPNDHSSGSQVTVNFITSDVLPPQDSGFNSIFFTPGQQDVRSAVRTPGSIFSITAYSGQNYEYQMSASWTINAEAQNAQIGDSVVDSTGKEFQITFLEVDKFSSPFRVQEVIKEGIPPSSGIASLYRPTLNYEFFQGTELTDPARTIVRNRDDFQVDLALKGIQDQIDLISGSGSGTAVELDMLNDSGSAIAAGTPVRINDTGGISPLDPSVEAEALAVVGITKASINNGEQGIVVAHGKIENITTTAALNDRLYISATGGITESQPNIGIGGFLAGDLVISLGVVSKNLTNPANKDLIINIEIVGQL